MKLTPIPLSKIVIPETRVSAVYDEETAQLLRDSLKAAGTINPVIVVATEEGFVVVDGRHRCQEALQRGDREIQAVVYEGGAKEALLMNLVLNKVRGKTKASELVAVLGSLSQDYKMDPDQIQEKTGLSRDYIEKLLKISQASPVVQQALDEEIIGVGQAFEISRLPFPIQQEELITKVQVYKLPVKDVRQFVDNVLREMELLKQQPPPAAEGLQRQPRTYTCEGCKQEVDPRYLRPVMVCPDCFGAVWRLAKAAETPKEEVEKVREGV